MAKWEFFLSSQVRRGAGGRPARRAARVLRGHHPAEPRPQAHHEEERYLLLHEHHQGGELGVQRGQSAAEQQ